jgi:hypothetical protein
MTVPHAHTPEADRGPFDFASPQSGRPRNKDRPRLLARSAPRMPPGRPPVAAAHRLRPRGRLHNCAELPQTVVARAPGAVVQSPTEHRPDPNVHSGWKRRPGWPAACSPLPASSTIHSTAKRARCTPKGKGKSLTVAAIPGQDSAGAGTRGDVFALVARENSQRRRRFYNTIPAPGWRIGLGVP